MDSYDSYTGTGTGDFHIQLNNTNALIETNSVARFYVSGNTQNLKIAIYAYGAIVDARDLVAQNINVYHRGTNDIFVHPLETLTGDLYSLGNLISVTHPPIVNVIQHYDGRLIFY